MPHLSLSEYGALFGNKQPTIPLPSKKPTEKKETKKPPVFEEMYKHVVIVFKRPHKKFI